MTCPAFMPRERWWPKLLVTGDGLLALGHAPGPAFRAALGAAEDAQLAGADYGAAFSAALSALAQVQPANRS